MIGWTDTGNVSMNVSVSMRMTVTSVGIGIEGRIERAAGRIGRQD